ncbi:MAG TPA: putative toxin-antitoxin system toxin component, PIN family [Burkholderiales bacterium]|nr:putative toxin-antitoxin system toxin component, PIN family [Burkholderiales bacterium]
MLRLVLDTNVWLDWLVFDDPSIAPLKKAVAEKRAEVIVDEAAVEELTRVLAYSFGARTLSAQAQAAAIAECLRIARKDERGTMKDDLPSLPRCSDPDDQKFLELALACGAICLVTRDDALLQLARGRARALPFRIVTPQACAGVLEPSRGNG